MLSVITFFCHWLEAAVDFIIKRIEFWCYDFWFMILVFRIREILKNFKLWAFRRVLIFLFFGDLSLWNNWLLERSRKHFWNTCLSRNFLYYVAQPRHEFVFRIYTSPFQLFGCWMLFQLQLIQNIVHFILNFDFLLYVLNNITGSSYFLLTCFCGVRSFAFYYHNKTLFFFLVHFWIDDHVAVSFKMRTFKMLSLLL